MADYDPGALDGLDDEEKKNQHEVRHFRGRFARCRDQLVAAHRNGLETR